MIFIGRNMSLSPNLATRKVQVRFSFRYAYGEVNIPEKAEKSSLPTRSARVNLKAKQPK